MKSIYALALLPFFAAGGSSSDNRVSLVETRPDAKVFRWPEHTAGDCHMLNATLVIRPNGSASFDSDLWTHTHGTDYWHSTIRLFGGGHPMGDSGSPHNSPGIGHPQDGPGHRVHFHYDFGFPAGNFPAINEAVEHGDC